MNCGRCKPFAALFLPSLHRHVSNSIESAFKGRHLPVWLLLNAETYDMQGPLQPVEHSALWYCWDLDSEIKSSCSFYTEMDCADL